VAQLLLLKMPLMDVFKALSDATTTPWTNYERSTDPKSPAHLEELRDDLHQFVPPTWWAPYVPCSVLVSRAPPSCTWSSAT
jgi:hypothetical protein